MKHTDQQSCFTIIAGFEKCQLVSLPSSPVKVLTTPSSPPEPAAAVPPTRMDNDDALIRSEEKAFCMPFI